MFVIFPFTPYYNLRISIDKFRLICAVKHMMSELAETHAVVYRGSCAREILKTQIVDSEMLALFS